MTSEQHGFIHAPRDRLLHHSRRYRTIPRVLSASFIPSIACSTFSFKLICSPPSFAVLKHHAFPTLFPWHLVPTVDHSAPPMNASSRQASLDPLCCVRLHVSQDTRLVSTRCTLEFRLSVRLNVNLHDVLNLSSISIEFLDLLSVSTDVLDLLSISIEVLDLSFP